MSPMARFTLRFVLLFLLFAGAFELVRGSPLERMLVEQALLVPAAAGARLLSPGSGVQAEGRVLRGDTASLRVVRGCDGIESWCLLAAAVLAWPASARRRAVGLAVGSTLVLVLGVLRLVVLFLMLEAWPGSFEVLHGLALPLAVVAAVALYFGAWAGLWRPTRP